MKELVELLPVIMLYVTLGFFFLKPYKAVRKISHTTGTKNVIIESLIIGFVINSVYQVIPCLPTGKTGVIIGVALSFVAGYLLGLFLNSSPFEVIRRKLKVYDTFNDCIWADIEDKDYGVFMRLENYEQKLVIDGHYVLRESNERYPLIQLAGYTKTIKDKTVDDYSGQMGNTILLDTSKFDDVMIFYDSHSSKTKKYGGKV